MGFLKELFEECKAFVGFVDEENQNTIMQNQSQVNDIEENVQVDDVNEKEFKEMGMWYDEKGNAKLEYNEGDTFFGKIETLQNEPQILQVSFYNPENDGNDIYFSKRLFLEYDGEKITKAKFIERKTLNENEKKECIKEEQSKGNFEIFKNNYKRDLCFKEKEQQHMLECFKGESTQEDDLFTETFQKKVEYVINTTVDKDFNYVYDKNEYLRPTCQVLFNMFFEQLKNKEEDISSFSSFIKNDKSETLQTNKIVQIKDEDIDKGIEEKEMEIPLDVQSIDSEEEEKSVLSDDINEEGQGIAITNTPLNKTFSSDLFQTGKVKIKLQKFSSRNLFQTGKVKDELKAIKEEKEEDVLDDDNNIIDSNDNGYETNNNAIEHNYSRHSVDDNEDDIIYNDDDCCFSINLNEDLSEKKLNNNETKKVIQQTTQFVGQ